MIIAHRDLVLRAIVRVGVNNVKIDVVQCFVGEITIVEKEFAVGQKVRVVAMPPYVKTAEPKPMLRPPSVIAIGVEGIVIDRRPGNYWGIRFEKGSFLLDSQYIEAADTSERSNLE